MEDNYKVWKHLIAGSFSAFFARLVVAPFDLAKIRLQLYQKFDLNTNSKIRYDSLWKLFCEVRKEEGLKTFWRGNTPALMLWMVQGGTQFALYGYFKAQFTQGIDQTFPQHKAPTLFIFGALSSSICTLISYPFDLMRTTFAAQGLPKVYPSILNFCQSVHKTYGFRGFYTGSLSAQAHIIPYMGLNFAIHDVVHNILNDKIRDSSDSPAQAFKKVVCSSGLAGFISGTASKAICYPLDTVKKRIQAKIIIGRDEKYSKIPPYNGIRDCLKKIIYTEGYSALFAGFVLTVLKSAISNGIAFSSFQFIRQILRDY